MGNENESTVSNTTTSSNNNINVRVQKFVDTVNSTFDRKFHVTEKVKGNFKARISKYSSKEILDVINNLKLSTYHINTNFRYCTPEFILREQKIELYKSGPIIDSKHGELPKQDTAKTEEKHADFYESQRG